MRQIPKNAILYEPFETEKIKGCVQIVHGMCEHQLRYKELAAYLNENGYAVLTSDLRGHGENITLESDLGYFGENALNLLVGDVHELTTFLKSRYTDVSYFLLGHSMGTLICTNYFRRYDNFIDGLFLSGMPGNNSASSIAKLLIKIIRSFKGDYYRSSLLNSLVNGSFSKKFKKEGSDFAWISKDRENIRNYEKDPKCGFVFTLNGFDTLMDLLQGTYSGSWNRKNPGVPIRLMSGEDDPCMGSKSNFMKSVKLFKNAGYSDVDYILYPGQRHEIFNDTEKETAMKYLVSQLDEAAEKKAGRSRSTT